MVCVLVVEHISRLGHFGKKDGLDTLLVNNIFASTLFGLTFSATSVLPALIHPVSPRHSTVAEIL